MGYLNSAGYNGHVFPIVITETGSNLQNPGDADFYTSLVQYIQNTGDAVDGQHNAITSVFWWYAQVKSKSKKSTAVYFFYLV